LSFKEKRELELLEAEIAVLETEKSEIESDLQSGTLSAEALTRCSERWAAILPEIELKTDRWMELSDRESSV
jgi:ATP-binding cassette subfamily F protein uup